MRIYRQRKRDKKVTTLHGRGDDFTVTFPLDHHIDPAAAGSVFQHHQIQKLYLSEVNLFADDGEFKFFVAIKIAELEFLLQRIQEERRHGYVAPPGIAAMLVPVEMEEPPSDKAGSTVDSAPVGAPTGAAPIRPNPPRTGELLPAMPVPEHTRRDG